MLAVTKRFVYPALQAVLAIHLMIIALTCAVHGDPLKSDVQETITKEMVYRELANINAGSPDYFLLGQAYQNGLYVKQSNEMAIRYYRELNDHVPAMRALLDLYSQEKHYDRQQALLLIQSLEQKGESGLIGVKLYHEIRSGLPLPLDYITSIIQGQPKTDAYIYLALAHWYYDQNRYAEAIEFLIEANNQGLTSSLTLDTLRGDLWSPKLLGLTVSNVSLATMLDELDKSDQFIRTDSNSSVIPYTSLPDSSYEGIIIEPGPNKKHVTGIQLVFSKGSEFSRAYNAILDKHGKAQWVSKKQFDYLSWSSDGYHITLTVPRSGVSCDHLRNVAQLPKQQRRHIRDGRCLTLSKTKSKSLYIQYNFPTDMTVNTQGAHDVEY